MLTGDENDDRCLPLPACKLIVSVSDFVDLVPDVNVDLHTVVKRLRIIVV